jgi:1-acyl-sn-glycerol-3-phosphate acyltransferase
MLRWFVWYSRRYLRRHFHGFRVGLEDRPTIDPSRPLVIFLNHTSWWDPLTVLLITQHFFPERRFYAPIDAAALEKYGILRRIGLFGVEQGTLRGARQFLERSTEALASPNGNLCVTPQGRFADSRERPLAFEAGLGQLAKRLPDAVFLPLAIEYPFWEERLPEVLAHFGQPADLGGIVRSSDATGRLEAAMLTTMDKLQERAVARHESAFENILLGSVGVGGIYDLWRRTRSWLRGERFVAEHSQMT